MQVGFAFLQTADVGTDASDALRQFLLGDSECLAAVESFDTSMIRKPKIFFYPGKRLQEVRTTASFERVSDSSSSGDEDSDSPTP